jgi:hypothetical protein
MVVSGSRRAQIRVLIHVGADLVADASIEH